MNAKKEVSLLKDERDLVIGKCISMDLHREPQVRPRVRTDVISCGTGSLDPGHSVLSVGPFHEHWPLVLS
jgi:hypothetical protein